VDSRFLAALRSLLDDVKDPTPGCGGHPPAGRSPRLTTCGCTKPKLILYPLFFRLTCFIGVLFPATNITKKGAENAVGVF